MEGNRIDGNKATTDAEGSSKPQSENANVEGSPNVRLQLPEVIIAHIPVNQQEPPEDI